MSWGGVQGTQEGGGHSQGPGVSRSTKGELGAWLMQPFRGAGQVMASETDASQFYSGGAGGWLRGTS